MAQFLQQPLGLGRLSNSKSTITKFGSVTERWT